MRAVGVEERVPGQVDRGTRGVLELDPVGVVGVRLDLVDDEAVRRDGADCRVVSSLYATELVTPSRLVVPNFGPQSPELVATCNSVLTFGVEGYFDTPREIGTAEAFSSPAFVEARTTTFLEPGDAVPVMTAVLSALKQVD